MTIESLTQKVATETGLRGTELTQMVLCIAYRMAVLAGNGEAMKHYHDRLKGLAAGE